MDEQTDEKTQNMLVDHLFQCRTSPWPKTAKNTFFAQALRTDRRTDGPTDGPTDRPTDRPSYRDAFLTDASKNDKVHNF